MSHTNTSRRCHHWTLDESAELLTLMDRRVSWTDAAAALNRTVDAVRRKVRALKIAPLRDGVLTGNAAATLLGVNFRTIYAWIAHGYLPASRPGFGPKASPYYLIERDALERFLEDGRYRHLWCPDRLADAALRDAALEALAGQPRYFTVREAAAHLTVSESQIRLWCNTRQIPATRRGGVWLIRELDCLYPAWRRVLRGVA